MLSEKALEARRAYQQKWRDENRERVRQYYRDWSHANKDKLAATRERYWERKAAKGAEEDA